MEELTDDRDLSISASFLATVASPRVRDLVEDVAELSLDAITDDDVLRQIPFVKTLVALKGLRERFLLRKTYRFFAKVNEMPQEEREAYISGLMTHPQRARKIGETFAVWLDRLDDEEKAEFLAKVFELYVRGKIDFNRSARFAAIIDRGHLPYLLELRRGGAGFGEDVKSHLLALGLYEVRSNYTDMQRQLGRDVAPYNIELVKMELNEDGRIFRDHVVGEMPVEPRMTERVHTPPKKP